MIETDAALRPAGKLAIALGGVLGGVAGGTIQVMLPRISDAFGTADNGLYIKMVATAAGLGMMIGAPVGGWFSDRYGRAKVLAIVTFIFGLVGCGMFFADQLWQLVAGRFVVGLMAGASAISYIALIGDHFDNNDRGRWLSINNATATALVVLLNPVTGALTDLGWQYGFLVYAAAVPSLLLIFAGLRDGPRDSETAEKAAGISPRSVIAIPPWSALLLAVVGGTLATGTSLYWPFRFREVGVESARDIALYALPNIAILALLSFSYGRVRRHLSVDTIFMLCGFLSAAGVAIMALSQTPPGVTVGLMFEGAGVGLLVPNISFYTIGLSPPERRAGMIGMVQGVNFGSPFLTQFVLEWINHRGGTSAALLAIAVMALALGVVILLRRARPRGTVKA